MMNVCEVMGCDEEAEYIDYMGDFICSACMSHALENEDYICDDFELILDK